MSDLRQQTRQLETMASGAPPVRELSMAATGQPTADGDGVKLTRIIGTPSLNTLDPFLLLDAFESDQPGDYIGGFPAHPHRGFETVTYLLAGRMRHKDNAGHEGVVEPGGVQWMTAGRGIVHSEMPEQEDGLLHGFQLWVNLPAKEKMRPPAYQEFGPDQIPTERLQNGVVVRVIAGVTERGIAGPVHRRFTDTMFFDVSMPPGAQFQQAVDPQATVFIYVIDGEVAVGQSRAKVERGQLGVMGPGHSAMFAAEADARFLFFSGRALNEPIARSGPFVMNTRAELLQAFDDFQNGRF